MATSYPLQARGPYKAEDLRSGDPYELSNGHRIECFPTGGSGSTPNRLGASVVGWDPAVTEAGVDTGYKTPAGDVRAPDVAVGNVPNRPGWVPGVPDLAIEYADIGQEEDKLQRKIADLLVGGTRYLWVVRLAGPRRVEVHEPGQPMRVVGPGHTLAAPGVLKNPVRVEALYDCDEAERATLTNLLQRRGYADLEDVLAKGREDGLADGLAVGLRVLRGALRDVLAGRRIETTAEMDAAVERCVDPEALRRWIVAASIASTAAEVFSA